MDTMAPGAPEPPERRLPIRFVGSGSEYFRIWIVNLLLILVTLGLYYPFAKVRKLRYFHGATEIDDHPLAFEADPWKMLRGYLLAGALVALYSVAGQVSATAGLVAFVLVAAVWPALWHSSLRFRLANTSWRGLRFRFVGRRGDAYRVMAVPIVAVGLFIGTLLWLEGRGEPAAPGQPMPLGLALLPLALMGAFACLAPWFAWLMRRYRHDHFALGAERTRFSLRVGAYYAVALVAALLTLAVAVSVGGVAFGLAFLARGGDTEVGRVLGMALAAIALYASVFVAFGAYVGSRLQNRCWNATKSAHLAFESRLSARTLGGVLAKNLVFTVLTLGLYWPFAAVALARLKLQALTVLSTIDPATLIADAQRTEESAAGDAAGDLFGFDLGL
jgi:uncharacterized membrane protein YjgN (DUF898 family)